MSETVSAQSQFMEQSTRGEARVNGIRLVYRSWTGPAASMHAPVVLLHGVLQSGEGMANLAAHLARRGPVVVPDLRGRGESDQPNEGYDPATMADDIAALINLLGLERPVVIGRLHGGLVAYHLAARHPALVRGVVLGDTAPEVDQARTDRALAAIRALPNQFSSLDNALAYYQDHLLLSPARARHDIPYDLIESSDGSYRWRHNLALIERIEAAAMPRADWEIVARVECPALVLRGQRGQVPPAVADRFCRVLPACQVQTILGAGHDVFLGPGAEQTFGAIDLFLRRTHEATATSPVADAPASDAGVTGSEVIERMVRAINARDDEAIAALFAPDGRITIHRSSKTTHHLGPGGARAAFRDMVRKQPGAAMTAHDIVTAGDRFACVLTLRRAASDGATMTPETINIPMFARLHDSKIIDLTSFVVRLPTTRASADPTVAAEA